MIKLILIFLLSASFYSLSQTRHIIYFKDKGIAENQTISKGSKEFETAMSNLSEKSIRRRLKILPADSLISFEDLPLKTEYMENLNSLGIKIINKLKWFNAVSGYLDEEQIYQLKSLEFIKKIEPVKKLIFTPDKFELPVVLQKQEQYLSVFDYGPSYSQLQLCDIPFVHSKGITGEGVLVGLLDTGFDWKSHESLQNSNILTEYDFVFGDSITSDQPEDTPGQHSHGTLVFSIIGGFKDSTLIGASFGSDFMLAKTEDIRSETHIEEDNYAAAMEWMENYGVDIISSSLGYNIFDPSTFSYNYSDMNGKTTIVTRACEIAYRKGVATFTAAGNEGGTNWYYIIAPADGFNTLAIGAVDANNVIAGFSSRGPTYDGRIKPDLVTRGVNVYGAAAGTFNQYAYASGTSVATPIASGIAALLLSAHPHLTNSQVRNIFYESSDNNLSPDNIRGYGLISAAKAIQFPNLEFVNSGYTLHKIFLDPEDIIPSSVVIHYSIDGQNYQDQQMTFDNNLTYTFKFPYLINNETVDFYFTFINSQNISFRDPQSENYKFYYGQLNISLNLDAERSSPEFRISEPYPNPFLPQENGFSRISIRSNGGEKLKIVIIDPTGQKIKEFNSITFNGENHFDWDGKSGIGTYVASGVYFYLIELNGKKFGRKIVLLR